MKKILVIEDNDLLRDNIEEILELEGFEVHSAENGQVGIDKARDVLPDLIVSDVNMPLVDGFVGSDWLFRGHVSYFTYLGCGFDCGHCCHL